MKNSNSTEINCLSLPGDLYPAVRTRKDIYRSWTCSQGLKLAKFVLLRAICFLARDLEEVRWIYDLTVLIQKLTFAKVKGSASSNIHLECTV